MREGSIMLWELLKTALGSERTATKKERSCQMQELHLQMLRHCTWSFPQVLIQKCALGTEQLS